VFGLDGGVKQENDSEESILISLSHHLIMHHHHKGIHYQAQARARYIPGDNKNTPGFIA
jgi:hypothetical protein